MRLLLDTHILLWWLQANRKLPRRARTMISRAASVYVSSATIWELAIKIANERIRVNIDDLSAEIFANGFQALTISYAHAAMIARLPPIHRDPFGRMLIAQSVCESLKLLTADKVLAEYSALVEVI